MDSQHSRRFYYCLMRRNEQGWLRTFLPFKSLRRRYSWCTVSFLLVLPVVGCLDDRTLVGGYRLKYMNGCEVRLFPDQPTTFTDEMVAGNIQSYAVRAPFITGYADTRCIDLSAEPKAQPGYFLIDTRTHGIQQSMTAEEWRRELHKIGWDNPSLRTVRRTKG
jgi:hypothetical protein